MPAPPRALSGVIVRVRGCSHGCWTLARRNARQAILASLGEGAPPALTPGELFQLRSLLAAFALLKLRADETLVQDLVTTAEDHAFAAGFSPPPAV